MVLLKESCVEDVIQVGKGVTNDDIDDIIRIIKSLENSGVLID